jgi:hypothetical protein
MQDDDPQHEQALPQRTHTRTRKRQKQSEVETTTSSHDPTAAADQEGAVAAEEPMHVPAYRSGAVPGYAFECTWLANVSPTALAAAHAHRCPLPADLDHTADVQLHACERGMSLCICTNVGCVGAAEAQGRRPHAPLAAPAPSSWEGDEGGVARPDARPALPLAGGADLKEAFQNVALAMYNYMTPISAVAIDEDVTRWARARAGTPRGCRALPRLHDTCNRLRRLCPQDV